MRAWIPLVVLALAAPACDRSEDAVEGQDEVEVHEDLGTLRVMNSVQEPVAIYLDGQELYAVPPGTAYTFRNLPAREVTIYGVGRISQRHYDLPRLTITEGGEYEWTIQE